MSDHNSRDLEGPDRSVASTSNPRVRTDGGTQNDIVRDCLAAIDYLTRTLLSAIRDAETDLETTTHENRREAARHVRGIRAEASQVGLLLVGSEAVIPYRPGDDPDRGSSQTDRPRSFTTSYLGPDAEALERELERQRGESGDGCAED
ncbi:hypothetical protein [Natrinema salsiterrestre]|uniref:Uncharacterized protein n=1 Tax=Natrinema salsiterrestre TaxID=2950540 RepID=A0A9Q4PZR3_9EURY|nr:hypothetical protein [Natrinema salsiterrestre]MDF9744704.1 hypothetical protein [Natrinema salsiterrestre]